MAQILVTGGAGYIGSHVCKALKNAGHSPVSYDNLSRGFAHAVKWGPLVEGDVRDVEKLKKSLQDFSIEGVIHLAAYAYVGESVENPKMYFENNVDGMALLLEALQETGTQNLVFSSSCATYGESQKALIDEDHPQAPINPYGLSKLMGEKMLLQFRNDLGHRACGLRYFNAAGADPDLEIGENHDPEPHLIPNLIRTAQQGGFFQIFGSDYDTPDGTCVRDFIHVSDLADAHVLCLEKLLNEKNGEGFYNLGCGEGYSLLQVANSVNQVLNKNCEIQFLPPREGDPARLVCDSQLFRDEFQWIPKHSSLEKMIQTASEWEIKKGSHS